MTTLSILITTIAHNVSLLTISDPITGLRGCARFRTPGTVADTTEKYRQLVYDNEHMAEVAAFRDLTMAIQGLANTPMEDTAISAWGSLYELTFATLEGYKVEQEYVRQVRDGQLSF